MQQYAALGASGFGVPSATATSSAPSTDASTLGAAATQAASLGANQAWWTQLAVQDYLARAQQAAATAATPAPPQASTAAQMPNYEQLLAAAAAAAAKPAAQPSPSTSADSLRLPSDTEIIKYTSSSTGPKVPGTTNRGRKKTISLDPSPAVAAVLAAAAAGGGGGGVSSSVHPAIPPGLTIERKKTASGGSGNSSGGGRKSSLSGDMVDRVEITKIPASISVTQTTKDFVMPRSTDDSVSITTMSSLAASAAGAGSGPAGGDGPLNLSMKPTAASASASSVITDYLTKAVASASGSQIPSEYYACECYSCYLDINSNLLLAINDVHMNNALTVSRVTYNLRRTPFSTSAKRCLSRGANSPAAIGSRPREPSLLLQRRVLVLLYLLRRRHDFRHAGGPAHEQAQRRRRGRHCL